MSYILALTTTYVVLLTTGKAQPALEFIIPFLLIGVLSMARSRREVRRHQKNFLKDKSLKETYWKLALVPYNLEQTVKFDMID